MRFSAVLGFLVAGTAVTFGQTTTQPAVVWSKPPAASGTSNSSVGSSASASPGSNTAPYAVPPARQAPPSTIPAQPRAYSNTAPSYAAAPAPVMAAPASHWLVMKQVAPVYPVEAEAAGIEGTVVVRGIVKADGTLRDLQAVSGPAELQQAGVDAAAQYVYAPAYGSGRGEAPTMISVNFHLEGPARVPADVMAGRIAKSYIPTYPAAAQAAGVAGTVRLDTLIGRQGQVEDVKVVSGPEMLRDAAVDTVKHWTYTPYLRNGVDVEVRTQVVVTFRLP